MPPKKDWSSHYKKDGDRLICSSMTYYYHTKVTRSQFLKTCAETQSFSVPGRVCCLVEHSPAPESNTILLVSDCFFFNQSINISWKQLAFAGLLTWYQPKWKIDDNKHNSQRGSGKAGGSSEKGKKILKIEKKTNAFKNPPDESNKWIYEGGSERKREAKLCWSLSEIWGGLGEFHSLIGFFGLIGW